MNSPAHIKNINTDAVPEAAPRHWPARLHLQIAQKSEKSVLLRTEHEGPLRVQRPFYPESDGCCHVYLLHPPGGLVIGDELQIDVQLDAKAQALLTTPAAGKFYGAKNRVSEQSQKVELAIDEGACLEWLPQETIIFNSAQAHLKTRVHLRGDAKFFGWDMLRLGRVASGEHFESGFCLQSLELWQDNAPLFAERNHIVAGSELHKASWGLRASNATGTLLATLALTRDEIDELYNKLEHNKEETDLWGLTQKNKLFIARYLGNSITRCRNGFELIWRETRKQFKNTEAHRPRIWNT